MSSRPDESESGNAGDFVPPEGPPQDVDPPPEEPSPDPAEKEELLNALENRALRITQADSDFVEKINSSKGKPFFWGPVSVFKPGDLILVWETLATRAFPAFHNILQAGEVGETNISSQEQSYPMAQILASLALNHPIDETILREQVPDLDLMSSTFIGNPGYQPDDALITSLVRPTWELILEKNPEISGELINWLDLDLSENAQTEDFQEEFIKHLCSKKVSLRNTHYYENLRDINSEQNSQWHAIVNEEEMDLELVYAPKNLAEKAGLKKEEGFQFILKTGPTGPDTSDPTNKIRLHNPLNLETLEKEGDAEESIRIIKYIDSQFSHDGSFRLENPDDYKILWALIFDKNPGIRPDLARWVGFDLPGNEKKELSLPGNEKKELSTLKNQAFSDRWTKFDGLGYQLYAEAITRPILEEVTQPPIAIAIQAPWGQGKTSLMRMIQEKLDKNKPAQEEKKSATFKTIFEWMNLDPPENMLDVKKGTIPTVWFNPLYYQNSEQIWAGLAHTILKQLSDRLSPIEREKFWFYLQLKRIDTKNIRMEVHRDIFLNFLPKMAYWAIGAVGAALGTFFATPLSLSETAQGSTFVAVIIATFHFIKEKWRTEHSPLYDRFKDCVQEPDYESKMGFLHFVDSDLKRALELLLENKPFAIFIDDLDRCPPETISEIILAINQFLSVQDKKAIFFLGMDMQMVAEALEKSQGKQNNEKDKIHASGKSFGWDFMDKFIQLPFFIPKIDEDLAKDYMSGLMKKGSIKTTKSLKKTGGETLFKRIVRWIRSAMKKGHAKTNKSSKKTDARTSEETPFQKMSRRIRSTQKLETLLGLEQEIMIQEIEPQFETIEINKLISVAASQRLGIEILEVDNLEQLNELALKSRTIFEGGDLQYLEQKLSKKSSELLEDPRENELEDLVRLSIEELDYNPRTVKRFLNLAKLLHNINLVRGSEGDADYNRSLIVRAAHLVLNWPRVVRWLQDGDSQYQINGKKVDPNPAALLQNDIQNKNLIEWREEIKNTWGETVENTVGDSKFYRFLQKIANTHPDFPELINSSLFTCHAKLIAEFEDEDPDEATPQS